MDDDLCEHTFACIVDGETPAGGAGAATGGPGALSVEDQRELDRLSALVRLFGHGNVLVRWREGRPVLFEVTITVIPPSQAQKTA